MKVLVLKHIGEDSYGNGKYTLEYQDGDIENDNNYVEELVGSYNVYFDYKGISFEDDFITEALTNYFDKQFNSKECISFEKINKMFDTHMDLKDSNTITRIKRICIEYAIQKLKEISYE